MKSNWLLALFVVSFVSAASLFAAARPMPLASVDQASPAPEFTHADRKDWVNSEPLTLKGLRGKVVLLDVWTFGCWNCYRSFPWLNAVDAKYRDLGLEVIGIHAPEFEHEKDRANLEKKLKEFELGSPQMIDNDFSYWTALNNRYWPTFYLIDKQGQLRGRYIGETHAGDKNAEAMELGIRQLLAE